MGYTQEERDKFRAHVARWTLEELQQAEEHNEHIMNHNRECGAREDVLELFADDLKTIREEIQRRQS